LQVCNELLLAGKLAEIGAVFAHDRFRRLHSDSVNGGQIRSHHAEQLLPFVFLPAFPDPFHSLPVRQRRSLVALPAGRRQAFQLLLDLTLITLDFRRQELIHLQTVRSSLLLRHRGSRSSASFIGSRRPATHIGNGVVNSHVHLIQALLHASFQSD
jgi:hypothetical protein